MNPAGATPLGLAGPLSVILSLKLWHFCSTTPITQRWRRALPVCAVVKVSVCTAVLSPSTQNSAEKPKLVWRSSSTTARQIRW